MTTQKKVPWIQIGVAALVLGIGMSGCKKSSKFSGLPAAPAVNIIDSIQDLCADTTKCTGDEIAQKEEEESISLDSFEMMDDGI